METLKSDSTTTVNTPAGAVEVLVRKCVGGWGGTWNPRTSKPYAAFVAGKILCAANGSTRTFATRESARIAGEAAAAKGGAL